MSSIQLQIYDFAMAAGGSFPLPVAGSYFRILTTTGDVDVIGDTFGRLGPINRGQGLADKQYGRLTIQDRSGAPNSGTILVSDANFIDQTLYGSISLFGAVALDAATLAALEKTSVMPEASTSNYKSASALAANTADTVFTAAANTNGAILLTASISTRETASARSSFLAKATAPASWLDGEPMLMARMVVADAAANTFGADLQVAQFIPAGLGLHYIADVALTAAVYNHRACRYKLL